MIVLSSVMGVKYLLAGTKNGVKFGGLEFHGLRVHLTTM